MTLEIPPAFDKTIYRDLHPDLTDLSDSALIDHYNKFGKSEGRTSNSIVDRVAFASIITPEMQALEIGPFASPLLIGDQVFYCDVLNQNELRDRARSLGFNPEPVPFIHFQLGKELLDGIDKTFDAILSSHSMEHQPDLISHLKQVERRLSDQGRYFVIIPDKRYCFDKQIAPSTIADVILAYEEKRTLHNIKSVIEHRALIVENDAKLHWEGRRKHQHKPIDYRMVKSAINEFKQANDAYIDVHAWYFTPDTFTAIIEVSNELELISLQLERLYRTRYGSNEFWAILKKGQCEPHLDDIKTSCAERDALVTELDALAAERDALAAERDALAAERDALARERGALVNSISWKITKPLRCIHSLLVSPREMR